MQAAATRSKFDGRWWHTVQKSRLFRAPCLARFVFNGALTPLSCHRYCHFCQHVKVRAASMLSCENEECSRRFCQHCLLVHIQEDMDPSSSASWTHVDGKVRNALCTSIMTSPADTLAPRRSVSADSFHLYPTLDGQMLTLTPKNIETPNPTGNRQSDLDVFHLCPASEN